MKKINPKHSAITALVIATFALSACGGSSADEATVSSNEPSSERTARGPMFSELNDDQLSCLEEQGVKLPDPPEDGSGEGGPDGAPGEAPEGAPPEGGPEGERGEGSPPQGMPEGMEEMQAAMSECGIEMPAPPGGQGQPNAENKS